MGVTEDYKLFMYQDYGPLGEKEHIRLVRNKKNGQICVKKAMDYMPRDIIEFRSRNKSDYFPQLLEVMEADNQWIIIEEYVSGITLDEYMMGEPVPEEKAVKIARQICKALLTLHHAEPMIVYRDLKTENIMLTSDGKIKLVDFNISRSFQQGKKRDTVLLGTAEYAAPEQFGYFQTDNRTDIYAFGVLFNYMLTAKFPVDYISESRFSGLIRKCIELEPSRRYQKMEDILVELGDDEKSQQEKEATASESWTIPGFRSKTLWKMGLAVIGYLLIFYMGFSLEFTRDDGTTYPMTMQWIYRVSVTIAQISTVFFICNYRGVSEQLKKIYKHPSVVVRLLSYIVTWFFFFVIAIILTSIIEMIIF